jgi:hypothetical protein
LGRKKLLSAIAELRNGIYPMELSKNWILADFLMALCPASWLNIL